jgi:hypothetical protein
MGKDFALAIWWTRMKASPENLKVRTTGYVLASLPLKKKSPRRAFAIVKYFVPPSILKDIKNSETRHKI